MSQNLILIDALSLAGWKKENRRKEKKKENLLGRSFPGAGPALLAVLWVATVRCD
jgi:hypothetical protein